MYNDQVICIMQPLILSGGFVEKKIFHDDINAISNKRFGFIAPYILANNLRNPPCKQ